MIADIKTEKDDMMGLPMFDSTNVANWSKRLKMWLVRINGNRLVLDEKPERPPQDAAAAVRAELHAAGSCTSRTWQRGWRGRTRVSVLSTRKCRAYLRLWRS